MSWRRAAVFTEKQLSFLNILQLPRLQDIDRVRCWRWSSTTRSPSGGCSIITCFLLNLTANVMITSSHDDDVDMRRLILVVAVHLCFFVGWHAVVVQGWNVPSEPTVRTCPNLSRRRSLLVQPCRFMVSFFCLSVGTGRSSSCRANAMPLLSSTTTTTTTTTTTIAAESSIENVCNSGAIVAGTCLVVVQLFLDVQWMALLSCMVVLFCCWLYGQKRQFPVHTNKFA